MTCLAELLRRLTPLARQASAATECVRLSAAGASTAHLGRINPLAAEELDAVSARCPELAAQVAAAAWPDWNTPLRIRERSSSRMPGEHEPRSPPGCAARSRRPWTLPAFALSAAEQKRVRWLEGHLVELETGQHPEQPPRDAYDPALHDTEERERAKLGWDRNTGERGREVVPPLFRADGERAAGRR